MPSGLSLELRGGDKPGEVQGAVFSKVRKVLDVRTQSARVAHLLLAQVHDQSAIREGTKCKHESFDE